MLPEACIVEFVIFCKLDFWMVRWREEIVHEPLPVTQLLAKFGINAFIGLYNT
jgi:hypothetical protein